MREATMRVATAAGIIALASAVALGDTYNDLPTFQAATENLQRLNFDVDANGVPFNLFDQIGGRYGSLGVQFPTGNYISPASGPVSAPNGWFNDTTPDGGLSRVFDANFTATNVTAVGVHQVLFAGTGGTRMVAYDSGGAELGSVSGDNDSNTLDFFGLTTTTPIARVVVTFTTPNGWGLDDMYFGQSAGGGCEADFNGDNQVDFFDYLDFVAAFDAEDDSADFNGDNQVDFFDYLDFAVAFDNCQ